ncbi:hypothetical protein [Streptoalloteichus hindustanus]|uniref:Uncharacterized protein n=1 Tax=Streptoalloteichus hindustanus TaxID=2017 RepID=A0A1M5KSV8_STRHI|nr:hypothetical protein [Streptoalloteichus hindustanus]SHG55857.1 hypothetical protein SAMN05444320_11040 [Streptoalloteichus hindustanus]
MGRAKSGAGAGVGVGTGAGVDADERRQLTRQFGVPLAGLGVSVALVVYFGREWARAHARALGLHEGVLGTSTEDYLARGLVAMVPAFLVVGAVGLGWAWLDRRVRPWWRHARPGPVLGPALAVLAGSWLLLPMVATLVGRVQPGLGHVLLPLSFGVGPLVSVYVLHLEHVARRDVEPRWRRTLVASFTVAVVLVSLLWTTRNYADLLGRGWADEFPARLAEQAQVVVYSAERLHLTAPRVDEERLEGDASRYRYRYSGLRFLDFANGRYFLVSDGWMPQFGVVLVLSANDPSVRLEFVRDSRVP